MGQENHRHTPNLLAFQQVLTIRLGLCAITFVEIAVQFSESSQVTEKYSYSPP